MALRFVELKESAAKESVRRRVRNGEIFFSPVQAQWSELFLAYLRPIGFFLLALDIYLGVRGRIRFCITKQMIASGTVAAHTTGGRGSDHFRAKTVSI
jgi:hypothetical protein